MSRSRSEPSGVLLFTAVAVVSSVAVVWAAVTLVPGIVIPDSIFVDFRVNTWEGGRAILDGRNPVLEYAADDRHGSPYPPAAALVTLPFALLPYGLSVGVWVAALIGSVVAALLLCGVRDWRCVALALVSPPVIVGLAYGNVSLLFVLALAAAWLWRGRPVRIGVVLGTVIAGKLFLWPLLVWLLLARRRRAAAAAAASAVLVSLIGWAAIAFRGVEDFPGLLRRNASEYLDRGDSVASLIANLGASATLVAAGALAAGALAVVFAWRRREDELACFSWCVTAALLASPIVWTHYYAVMLVPLALGTPRLARAWLLPFLTAPQLTPSTTAGGNVLDATTGVLFVLAAVRYTARRDSMPARRPAVRAAVNEARS